MGMIRSLESVNVRKRSSPQRRALWEHLPPEMSVSVPYETPSRGELPHVGYPYRRIERPPPSPFRENCQAAVV